LANAERAGNSNTAAKKTTKRTASRRALGTQPGVAVPRCIRKKLIDIWVLRFDLLAADAWNIHHPRSPREGKNEPAL